VYTDEADRAVSEVMLTLYRFVCFGTLALMTFTEQFEGLPGAVAAFASGWYILRLGPPPASASTTGCPS